MPQKGHNNSQGFDFMFQVVLYVLLSRSTGRSKYSYCCLLCALSGQRAVLMDVELGRKMYCGIISFVIPWLEVL